MSEIVLEKVTKRFGRTEVIRGIDLAVIAVVEDLKKRSKKIKS